MPRSPIDAPVSAPSSGRRSPRPAVDAALTEPAETDAEVWLAMDAIAVLAEEAAELGPDFLSHQERARLAAVSGPKERAAFLGGRLLMRRLLARVHGGDPLTDWPLSATSDDAPAFVGEAFVLEPEAPWQMSIGHGGPYVACVVSHGRVALDLRADRSLPGPDGVALVTESGPGDVMLADQEWLALRDMDEVDRALYFQAIRSLGEAAVKCGSARANPAALRRLAQGDITPEQWAGELPALYDADGRARWSASADGAVPAMAWTWQGDGLTLAVVVPGDARRPQWALPPPPFALTEPVAWTLRVAPDTPLTSSTGLGGSDR